MTPRQKKIYGLHKLCKRNWDRNHDPNLEDLCHHLLQILLKELSPNHPKVQDMIIKNCVILSYRKDLGTIKKLMNILHKHLGNKDKNFIALSNRLKLMIA